MEAMASFARPYPQPNAPTTAPAPLETTVQTGTRRAVFALEEGDAIISFPDGLSAESVADLEAYLAIFMKKAKRDAEKVN